MTEAKALLTALLLFEGLERSGLLSTERPGWRDAVWLVLLGGAGAAGHLVFAGTGIFFPWLAVLVTGQAIRHRAGLIGPESFVLDRWRYFLPLALGILARSGTLAALGLLLVGFSRRNLRFVLLALARRRRFLTFSTLEVDQIVPPPIRIEHRRKEGGFMTVQAVVGLSLLVTISGALFLSAAGRTARLRQVREAALAREAAVSRLERLGGLPFEDLADQDGATFEVPGGPERGTVRVTLRQPGVAEVQGTAPRRGGRPVVLTTLRTRGRP